MAKKKNNNVMIFLMILLPFLVVGMFVFLLNMTEPQAVKTAAAEPVSETVEPEEPVELVPEFDKDDPKLVLVNKEHTLPADYTPDVLVDLDESMRASNRDPASQKLEPETAEAFAVLVEDAAAAGHTIKLTSGYRNYAMQEKLYNHYLKEKGQEWTDMYSAPPGASEHHTGLAADVSCSSISYVLDECFADTDEGIWLREHAYEYGFILRYDEGKEEITGYAYEPWHIRYVGKDAAKVITEKGITLEEFLSEI